MSALRALGPLKIGRRALPEYDAILAVVGYETRATFACRRLNARAKWRTAWAFTERQDLSFAENRRWFTASGFRYEEVIEADAEQWASTWVEELASQSSDMIRACIDISSMSRLRMASVLAALTRVSARRPITVDFIYSLAKWSRPSEDPEPIISAGAVLPFFAGWSAKPELPTIALIGLGYEPDKAVGAYEYLEATQVWTFTPRNKELRYRRDVQRANRSLLRRVPDSQQLTYRLDQPVTCFGTIESIVYGALTGTRPVLLPFGPKIFALCAMLVACVHRDLPVWRISSGQYGKPADRVGCGIVGLRALFGPTVSEEPHE